MQTTRFQATSVFIIACVAALLVPIARSSVATTLPQGEIAKFRNIPAWYLSFKITIKGSATNSFSSGNETVTWSFDDSYSGNVPLDNRMPFVKSNSQTSPTTPMEKAQAAMKQLNNQIQWAHFPQGVQRMGLLNGLVPLQIKINHKIISVTPDPCNDPITTTTRVVVDGNDFSYVMPTFVADTNRLTYNVNVAYLPDSDAKQVKVTQDVEEKIDGKPKKDHTEQILPIKFLRNRVQGESDVNNVLIKGLLEGGKIHHREDRPLDATGASIDFDSGDLQPDNPLISGVPETKEKVKIRLCYKIARAPISGVSCGN